MTCNQNCQQGRACDCKPDAFTIWWRTEAHKVKGDQEAVARAAAVWACEQAALAVEDAGGDNHGYHADAVLKLRDEIEKGKS